MNTRDFLKSKKIYVGANVADENAPENYFRLEDLLLEFAESEVKKISSNPLLVDVEPLKDFLLALRFAEDERIRNEAEYLLGIYFCYL
jgi:hypothetical protein